MFVRKHTVKGNTYFSLVENRWNSVRHKHQQVKLASLGKTGDTATYERARKIASSLTEFCTRHGMPTLSDGLLTVDPASEGLCGSSRDWGI